MEEEEMPKASDRRRAKDRIVEGIARAIKHIQSFQLSQSSEEQGIKLKNSDWQFHKLVENLDHAFLYGLRHFTRGYWVIVQEFTHRSTIEDIVNLSNVATDLGRSRAWLYLALSDRLLESYIHCFINNAELLRKHYVREALVLDDQRLELLLTLSSGLELIAFDLEVNVEYLDLCSCMKSRPENQEEDLDDNVSLSSMISSQSQSSSVGEMNWSRAVKSPLTLLSSFTKSRTFKQSQSTASLAVEEETEKEKEMRIETFASVEVIPVARPVGDSTGFDGVGGEVEVIRVKPKRHVRKRDRVRKSPSVPESDNSSLISVDSSACLLTSPTSLESSGYQTVQEDSGCTQCIDTSPSNLGSKLDNFISEAVIRKTHVEDIRRSNKKSPNKSGRVFGGELSSRDDKLLRILDDRMPPGKVYLDSVLEWKSATDPSAELKNGLPLVRSLPIFDTAEFRSAFSPSKVPTKQSYVNNRDEEVKVDIEANKRVVGTLLTTPVEEPSIYDDSQQTGPSRKDCEVSNSSVMTGCDVPPSKPDVLTSFVELSEAKRLSSNLSKNPVSLNECNVSQKTEMQNTQGDCFLKTEHSSEIKVDNNLKVVLMLDVFLHEEEVFFKMFQTCQGHTEGKIAATYVMITSHYLYLLRPSSLPNKFTREVAIAYKELDYIAVSLNHQVIHIVCRVRHNQFWITTGDEVLTRIIVSNLNYAVHKSSDGGTGVSSGPLTVLMDATAQKISIAKLVSEELGILREEVSLLNYSLVHWEDSEAVRNGDLCLDLSHEGSLFYKTYTATILFAAASWHQGYFVLERGVLHQYSDKNCSGTPMRSISLGSGQCNGCRRCPASDRKYAFEILLPHGSDFEFSASSEAELQEWLVRLDQAMHDQWNPRASTFGCVACCSVVTQSHVFMCHEDLQTNFLRSLGSLTLSSLSQIQTDESSPTCCVLVYKKPSGASREDETWCVYFRSAFEQEKFVRAIFEACKQSKQAVVETASIEAGMAKRCHAGIAKLKALHRMGVA